MKDSLDFRGDLPGGGFTGYQKLVIALLAFLQFTIILDFIILAPLGAILIPALKISTAQFGVVVSVYAFSAGISGILAASIADRFDRKKLLLFFYTGFILGTFLCSIAPTYHFLLFARTVTGIFGGVIGSIVLAIATDLFAFHLRGRVMGFVQTAFAASQVLGVPLGLVISNQWGWHAPFLMIVIFSLAVGVIIILGMRPVNGHLSKESAGSALGHLFDTVTHPRYLQAFATTALLSTGGFMLMPFSSAFSVNNLGISMEQLPLIYMVTGFFNIVIGPMIGRIADSIGKFKVFAVGSFLCSIVVVIYTHLGVTPIGVVILISILMFATITSRMISASALMSAVPAPNHRGAFMSVSASLQQIAGGVASALAGLIVVQTGDGPLKNFDVLGYVVVGAMMITVFMMYFINRIIPTAVQET